MVVKAFKFRVYPNSVQKRFFDESIQACWWFYRYVLHHYEDDYKTAKKNFERDILSHYTSGNYQVDWEDVDPRLHFARFHFKKRKVVRRDYYNKNKEVRSEILKITIPNECYFLGSPLRHQGVGKTSTYKLLQKVRSNTPTFSRYNLPNRLSMVNSQVNLSIIPATVMQEVLERVAHAFNKFWKEGGGYPNYPKERDYSSITWTGASSIELFKKESLLKLSKLPGLLEISYHRPIQGTIKRANISRDILGQYYVSLMCDFEEIQEKCGVGVIGIDMNIKQIDKDSRSFIALSDGRKIDIPRWATQFEDELAKKQRAVSKCVLKSEDWVRQDRKVKHLHEKIQNKKNDWLHHITFDLSQKYEYVVIEDMDLTKFHKKRTNPEEIDNMQLAGERGQRKGWTEASHGEFKRQLAYKFGDRLIKINPAYTSKTCNSCGLINNELTLGDRVWKCPCGAEHDRDINAAINIRNAGLLIKNQQEKMGEKSVAECC